MRSQKNRVPGRHLVTTIPSFTIMEAMVVAALSVLTVAAALSAWQIIEHQHYRYQQDTSEAIAMRQLEVLLKRDFFLAQLVTKQDSSLVFTYPDHVIGYKMAGEKITRRLLAEDGRDDVMPLPAISWGATFQGEPVEMGIVDGARLSTELLGQPLTLVFSKVYSAKEILMFEHGH